ncbi:GxxExxY protein [Carboxylicivirga taeanensis]|uniref:GxxExxY protein n=1 Tax=Carboxylicivirga taeanensis TaxID=1416875 RepID=UPI003F6E3475
MNVEAYNELTGLLEAVYEECLISELRNRGLKVESQVKLPIIYKGKELSKHFNY